MAPLPLQGLPRSRRTSSCVSVAALFDPTCFKTRLLQSCKTYVIVSFVMGTLTIGSSPDIRADIGCLLRSSLKKPSYTQWLVCFYRYPVMMNPGIRWPLGAEMGALVAQEHDRQLLAQSLIKGATRQSAQSVEGSRRTVDMEMGLSS